MTNRTGHRKSQLIHKGILLAILGALFAIAALLEAPQEPDVLVAAIQFHSRMGDPAGNRRRIAALVEKAAAQGARVVVLPEAAIPGYADLTNDVFWSRTAEPGYRDVRSVAEPVPGPSVAFFAPLADRFDLYLTVPIIEREGAHYFNTVVVLGPDGRVRAHYRKQRLWPVADAAWAAAGPERACTIETEFGRLGLMICYDVHAVLPLLGRAGAQIVLHPVAWYGPNSGAWFENTLALRVQEQGITLILANWTFPEDPGWSGHGHSLIIGPDGKVIAKAGRAMGDQIVLARVARGRTRTGPYQPAPAHGK